MSAFVLAKKDIELLTVATDAALRMNKRYSGSYYLHKDTIDLLSKYAGDLHMIYRALYITNIKAFNGRYGENDKTLPKYTPLTAWNTDRLDVDSLRKACGMFGCYMYQISEDPIDGSEIYNALQDVYQLLCAIYVQNTVDWDGETA